MPDIKEKTREIRCDGRAGRVLRDERECGGDGDEGGAGDGGGIKGGRGGGEGGILPKKENKAVAAYVISLSTDDERRITSFNKEIRRRGEVTRCYNPLRRR